MVLRRERCLHCSILSEIGRQFEAELTNGQRALDNLFLVITDILATAPPHRAQGMMAGVIQSLPLPLKPVPAIE